MIAFTHVDRVFDSLSLLEFVFLGVLYELHGFCDDSNFMNFYRAKQGQSRGVHHGHLRKNWILVRDLKLSLMQPSKKGICLLRDFHLLTFFPNILKLFCMLELGSKFLFLLQKRKWCFLW